VPRSRWSSYTDTHCHLYDTRGVALDDVLAAARAAGVVHDDQRRLRRGHHTRSAIEIASRRTTASTPPPACTRTRRSARHRHDPALPRRPGMAHVIAIGECGFDYYYDHSPRDAAPRCSPHRSSSPTSETAAVIHTRDAWADTFDVLAPKGCPSGRSSTASPAAPTRPAVPRPSGAYLSFSGIVTFKTATDLHGGRRLCPTDRLLAETDSPYLAPVPHRGRTNQPAFVSHVAQFVADLRDEPLDAFAAATVAATRSAFPALAR
jgi:TatD DNase family protein